MLQWYGHSVRAVSRGTLWLCVLGLAAAVGLNAIEIAARYFLGDSSLYRTEISLELCVAIYFIGYIVLLAEDEDVTMEYFHRRLPVRARLALDVGIAASIVVFFVVLLDASLDYFRLTRTMTHPVFPVSRGYTTVPIVVAAAGCLYVAVYRALLAIREATGHRARAARDTGRKRAARPSRR
jgi:TRAP-type C4-dicarboxylate transport system permease small subunit